MDADQRRKKMIRKMVRENPDEVLTALLEHPFWPKGLTGDTEYFRRSDDTDGEPTGLSIVVATKGSRSGDLFVELVGMAHEHAPYFIHCFRTVLGGGRSIRIRNAFLFLARAFTLDGPEAPASFEGSEETAS